MYNIRMCVLCNKIVSRQEQHPNPKIAQTNLIESAVFNKDSDLINFLQSYKFLIRVHKNCYLNYTKNLKVEEMDIQENSVKIATKNRESSKNKRIKLDRKTTIFKKFNEINKELSLNQSNFDWKSNCLFCEYSCKDTTKAHNKFSKFRICSTRIISENILDKCNERNDEWGEDVKKRTMLCDNALHEVEARYHLKCYFYFIKNKKKPSTPNTTKMGRPIDHDKQRLFDCVCEWLEMNRYSLLSLQEIINKVREFYCFDENFGYTCAKSIKRRLVSKYGDNIIFSNEENSFMPDIICFRDVASFMVKTKWQENKNNDFEENSKQLLIDSASLLVDELSELEQQILPLPSDSILTVENVKEITNIIPPLLNKFCSTLTKNKIKQISIAHSIFKAAKLGLESS